MRNRTVCFSGHRNISLSLEKEIVGELKTVILKLIKEDYRFFGVGGAMGFDTLVSKTILELKREYPNIRLILVLPCPSQADRWSENDRMIYVNIKNHADKIKFISDKYTSDCMYKRNRHLVDNSSVCVCYLTQKKGGTFYTVNYAKSKGLKIINLAENKTPE